MLAERLERDGIVDFSGAFARIIQGDKVRGFQRHLSNWIGIIVLPICMPLMTGTRKYATRLTLTRV